MSSGTGHGTTAIFENVLQTGGTSIRVRMRRVGTLQGISREPIDFTDLETIDVMDIRPGDLLSPGTFDLQFLADPTGTEANRPSAAQVSDLLASRNDDFRMVLTLPGSQGVITTTGFFADHDGPDLETNVPMEYRVTWQSRGVTTWALQ